MENNSKFIVSSTPHIRSNDSVDKIMRDVIIALLPASLAGIWFFGIRALMIILITIASSILFEAGYQKFTKQPITVFDLSAVVTGLLLALNLPSSAPYWMPVVGSFFAIVIAKQVFGGLGQNFINPALAARAFLVASYPSQMTSFEPTRFLDVDALTYATPLSVLNEGVQLQTSEISSIIKSAFIGNIGGCIGETCAIALILGGIYLLVKKVISWRIPVTYILTVWIFMLLAGQGFEMSVYHLVTGGLMLGAIFMATDYASSPVTPIGQLIMGFGCGLLTSIIRLWGGYPEGVSYSILLMNLAVPLIDRYTKPLVFGRVKNNGK